MGLPVKLAESMVLTKDEFNTTKEWLGGIDNDRPAVGTRWEPCLNKREGIATIKANSVFWLYFWAETGQRSHKSKVKSPVVDDARKVFCKIFGYGWDEADYNGFFALFDDALIKADKDVRTRGMGNDRERNRLRHDKCTRHCTDVFKKVLAYINAHDTPEERSSWCEKGQQMAVKIANASSGTSTVEQPMAAGFLKDAPSPSPSADATGTSTVADTVVSDDDETEVASEAKSESASGATDEYMEYEKAASENRVVSDGTVCATKEGRKILNVNYRYERSRGFIKKVKAMNSHVCDICGKNPDETYGRNPDGTYKVSIIEGHHIVPLSKYDRAHKVTEGDIALLCPNCHRVVHRVMGQCKEYNGDTYVAVKAKIKALLEDEK